MFALSARCVRYECMMRASAQVNSRALYVDIDGRLTVVNPAESMPSGRYFTSNNAPASGLATLVDEDW